MTTRILASGAARTAGRAHGAPAAGSGRAADERRQEQA